MSKTALIIAANGTEEMELVITADVLRRAEIDVTIAGLTDPLMCSRKVKVIPDTLLEKVYASDFDVIILPGGLEGTNALAESDLVKQCLLKQQQKNGLIAAICAAPYVLKKNGIYPNSKVTSHPSKEADMKNGYNYSEERVVIDGNLITSRAPGTAFEFAIAITEKLLKRSFQNLGESLFLKN